MWQEAVREAEESGEGIAGISYESSLSIARLRVASERQLQHITEARTRMLVDGILSDYEAWRRWREFDEDAERKWRYGGGFR